MSFEFCNSYFADQHVRSMLDEFACLYVREAQNRKDRADRSFLAAGSHANEEHDGGLDMRSANKSLTMTSKKNNVPATSPSLALCSSPTPAPSLLPTRVCDVSALQEHPKLRVITALRSFLQEHLHTQVSWRERHPYVLVLAFDVVAVRAECGEGAHGSHASQLQQSGIDTSVSSVQLSLASAPHRAAQQFAEKLAHSIGAAVIELQQHDAVIPCLSHTLPADDQSIIHQGMHVVGSPAIKTSAFQAGPAGTTAASSTTATTTTTAQSIAALRALITPESSGVDDARLQRLNHSRLTAVHELQRQISAQAGTGPAVLLGSAWPCAIADALMLADVLGEPRGVFTFSRASDTNGHAHTSTLNYQVCATDGNGRSGKDDVDSACVANTQKVIERMKQEAGFTNKAHERLAFVHYYRSLGILEEMCIVTDADENIRSPMSRTALVHAQSLLSSAARPSNATQAAHV